MSLVIGIAIDKWKKTIFERRLKAGGFTWTEHPGVMGTLLLKVTTDDRAALQAVCEAANTEAANVSAKD